MHNVPTCRERNSGEVSIKKFKQQNSVYFVKYFYWAIKLIKFVNNKNSSGSGIRHNRYNENFKKSTKLMLFNASFIYTLQNLFSKKSFLCRFVPQAYVYMPLTFYIVQNPVYNCYKN